MDKAFEQVYMKAAKHQWQGKPLGEMILWELRPILTMLNAVAPREMQVPVPEMKSKLIVVIYRLDIALEPLRPLGGTPVKPRHTLAKRLHQNMDFWRR